MQFHTAAQKETYERILPMMREIFGEFVRTIPDVPMIVISYGSAVIFVNVAPWADTRSVIIARSIVVTGAEITPDLMAFLLKENDNVRFGAFGLDSDNDIFFDQTIPGEGCDKEELKTLVMSVIACADQYDDIIRSRWGGQRAIDRSG